MSVAVGAAVLAVLLLVPARPRLVGHAGPPGLPACARPAHVVPPIPAGGRPRVDDRRLVVDDEDPAAGPRRRDGVSFHARIVATIPVNRL